MNLSNIFEQLCIIDLTHPLNSHIPTWDNQQGFEFREKEEKLSLFTSSGTHIDAPVYFNTKGLTIDAIELSQLIAPAHVIDMSKKAAVDTVISSQDVEAYEARYGAILPNSLVIAYTGWSSHWTNKQKYRNDLRFPTWGLDALKLLLHRKIAGVAIDTFGLESFDDPTFPGHHILMNENKYIIENIANCQFLPPKGAMVIALPLKIDQGNEAPARVIALIHRNGKS